MQIAAALFAITIANRELFAIGSSARHGKLSFPSLSLDFRPRGVETRLGAILKRRASRVAFPHEPRLSVDATSDLDSGSPRFAQSLRHRRGPSAAIVDLSKSEITERSRSDYEAITKRLRSASLSGMRYLRARIRCRSLIKVRARTGEKERESFDLFDGGPIVCVNRHSGNASSGCTMAQHRIMRKVTRSLRRMRRLVGILPDELLHGFYRRHFPR